MASALCQEDSLTSTMKTVSLSSHPQAEFDAQVAEFPHSFLMQNQGKMGIPHLQRVKSGLQSALAVGYRTSMENARARNLLAFILYQLNKPADALKELDLVLDMENQTSNVVTLANRAVILWRQCDFSTARDQVERLHEMKTGDADFQYLVVKAKAEMAFSYTRFGPGFSTYAIALFEEVIPEARKPEVWLWNFGLGLTRRRALRCNPRGVSTAPPKDFADENRGVLEIFLTVVRNCSCPSLQAKAYAEIATLLLSISKTPLRNEFFDMAGMSTTKACNTALDLDSSDKSVLRKCGVIFRCCNQPERACDLLEESLKLRVSTTAHHHLGITYKRLATQEKHKDQVKIPGYYDLLARQQSQSGAGHSIDDITGQFQKLSTGESLDSCHATDVPTGGEHLPRGPRLSLNRDTRAKQKLIKSPPGNVTQFSRDDKYVKEALHHFEKAIQVSEGENVRAIYDLALLQRSLGELEAAYETLKDMWKQPQNMFSFDHINVYEQMGQILMELAERETDEKKKNHLLHDSKSMLLTALKEASRIFKSTEVAEHLGEVFSSFPILFRRAEETDDTAKEIEEKVRLLRLIRKYKPYIQLLQQLEKLDPQKARDPEHQKLMIEGRVNLEEFVEAAALLEVLADESDVMKMRQLFGDVQYVLKIHLKAARQVLLRGLPAGDHFKSAFHEFVLGNPEETSSSEFQDSDASGSTRGPRNMVIVHEESTRAEAETLTTVLQTACGLSVLDIDRSTPAGRCELDELTAVKNSSLAVVLAGGELRDKTRYVIRNVAMRSTTVTLLVEGDKVPFLLEGNRSLACDASMFHRLRSAADGRMAEPEVEAIFEILNFLFNVGETV